MPAYVASGGLGISTGGAFGLGPPQNAFASNTARDTYASANAAWLAQYNANRGFWIRVGAALQRRNAAGTAWEDVTPVVQGRRGVEGPQGPARPFSTDAPLPLAAAASVGTDADVPHADHVHPWDGLATDDELAGARQAIESALVAHTSDSNIHLSPQQARDIARSIVGLSVTGSGINRRLVATRASGLDSLTLNISDVSGGGGGSGGEDVHLEATGSSYSESSQMLTLALSDGTTIQINLSALVTQLELTATLASYAALSGATFTGTTEGQDPTTAQGFTTRGYVSREIANAIAGATPEGRTASIVLAQLGQPNLAETDIAQSGLLNAAGQATSRLTYAVQTGQDDSGEQNLRWNPAIAGHSLPDGASYAPATGILTLPHGVWIIEAVLIAQIRQSTTQDATAITAVDVEARLYEGGEFRYSEGAFFWGQVDNHPTLSVTGSLVIPRGSTDTVQVRLVTTPASVSPNAQTIIENAHMEAIRLGDAPAVVASNAYIAWSPDVNFSAAEFLAGTAAGNAQEGAIPAQVGFAYLGLWLSADHWDAVRQIDIDHGPNGFSDLAAPVDLTINGVAGKYRRYATRLAGDVAGGATLRWR